MAILIVDDSLSSRRLNKVLLESGGFTDILFAQSAIEAFEVLDKKCVNGKQTIDLIL